MTNEFWHACIEKFRRKAKEENRSLEPWKDYDFNFLWMRLQEEHHELLCEKVKKNCGAEYKDGMMDELLDVANFCCFLWLKLKEEKE